LGVTLSAGLVARDRQGSGTLEVTRDCRCGHAKASHVRDNGEWSEHACSWCLCDNYEPEDA
jgi:hypothetical protein